MSALPHGALGRWVGCSKLPQKAAEEAAASGANSDLCGGETWREGRGGVPAYTETKQRSVPQEFPTGGGICLWPQSQGRTEHRELAAQCKITTLKQKSINNINNLKIV